MVEYLTPQFQNDLLKLLFAIAENKGEEIADIIVKLSHQEEDFSYYKAQEEISDLIARHQDLNWEDIGIGRMLLKITRHSSQVGLRLPQKFNTLGKTLLNLDRIVKVLAPSFNPRNFIRENVSSLLERKMSNYFAETNLSRILLETTDTLATLPRKVNYLFDLISKNEWKPRIQAFDEKYLMKGFEKIGNRIACGLVVAALIVGAALLMRVETTFTILGYPGLAILLFLAACVGGILFLFDIILHDEKKRKP